MCRQGAGWRPVFSWGVGWARGRFTSELLQPFEILHQVLIGGDHPTRLIAQSRRALHVGADELADEPAPEGGVHRIEDSSGPAPSWNPDDVPQARRAVG